MESVPSYYFLNYYFRDEVLRQLRGKATTRAEDILAEVPGYWAHYTEQAESDDPELDPRRSRGGIHELELAIDAMNAFYNDTGDVLPVNLPNAGGALPGFDDDVVVEVSARVDASGFTPLPQKPLPHAVRGLVQALAEHQVLAAKAGWEGDAADGVRALAAHPLVPTLPVAEELYAELATAHARLPAGPAAGVGSVPMEPLYLGVDAGNSKTVALLCDATGTVVGYGRSGNGDIYGAESEPAAVDAVVGSVNDALTVANAAGTQVGAAAFRLAGVDWAEDHAFWVAALGRHLPNIAALAQQGRCSILNDGFAAIRCGESSGVGVAVIGGTGSAVAGRGPTGAEWSMSFWIQDAHGASGLVHSALRAVYRADLGLGPQTALTKRLLAFFGAADAEDLLHQFTGRESQPSVPSHTAAREVLLTASDGNPVAADILRAHCDHLADYARVTAQRVGFAVDDAPDEVPVVLAGSVLAAEDSPVTAALLAALSHRFPGARPRLATLPPVAGAALDALADAGVALTPAVTERLLATAPPPPFLQT